MIKRVVVIAGLLAISSPCLAAGDLNLNPQEQQMQDACTAQIDPKPGPNHKSPGAIPECRKWIQYLNTKSNGELRGKGFNRIGP